jgi:hypothetical protein
MSLAIFVKQLIPEYCFSGFLIINLFSLLTSEIFLFLIIILTEIWNKTKFFFFNTIKYFNVNKIFVSSNAESFERK